MMMMMMNPDSATGSSELEHDHVLPKMKCDFDSESTQSVEHKMAFLSYEFEAGARVQRQRVRLYIVHCISLCCGFISLNCAPKQDTITIASSMDSNVNGGPVSRN